MQPVIHIKDRRPFPKCLRFGQANEYHGHLHSAWHFVTRIEPTVLTSIDAGTDGLHDREICKSSCLTRMVDLSQPLLGRILIGRNVLFCTFEDQAESASSVVKESIHQLTSIPSDSDNRIDAVDICANALIDSVSCV